jgi:hypothetical protein
MESKWGSVLIYYRKQKNNKIFKYKQMKTNTKLSSFVLLALLTLSACTMQKRVYNRGIHIEWLEGKGSDKLAAVHAKKAEKNQAKQIKLVVNETRTEINAVEENKKISHNTSTNKSIFIGQTATKTFNRNSKKTTVNESKLTFEKKSVTKELKNNEVNIESKSVSANDDSDGLIGLRILGWKIWSLGMLMILFVSILTGSLIFLLGILFVVLGKKKKDPASKSENKPEYIDVVYLKNGGVIRGMIIEQTPNVQIKIQTKDGSIFVYKMEEIEKMTKELSKS